MSHTNAADAYYSIGKSHVLCQDVALAGDFMGTQYALVCDGCSSSPRTELGAHLLASAFVKDLKSSYIAAIEPLASECDFDRAPPPTDTLVMVEIVEHAADLARLCGLSPASVDATLLSAVVHKGQVTVDVWGDGAVYWRQGSVENLITVEYQCGAPAYPSYLLSDTRRAAYRAQHGDFVRTVTHYTNEGAARNVWIRTDCDFADANFSGLDALSFQLPTADLVCLFSDGVGSFQKRVASHFESVPILDVVQCLVGFKNYAGAFVTRRVRRFLTHECGLLGWHHDDDLSVAAIKLGDAP